MLAGLLWFGGIGSAIAAGASSAASATSTQTVYLEYRELAYGVGNWTIPITLQSAPFKKEPLLGQRKVFRGTLKFGDSTEDFLPFIWDRAEGKLYLDLNRNRDLTDDGVFGCAGAHNSPQSFGPLRLPFKTPLGTVSVAVDLLPLDPSLSPAAAAVIPHYCWEAKVTQGGQEWQLALVDDLSGKLGSTKSASLIIRPWADRAQALDPEYDSLDFVPFSPNVFFGQRACHLDCALAQREGGIKYRLDLTERAETLGELRITGQYVHRVVLARTGPAGAPLGGNSAREAAEAGALASRYGLRLSTPAQGPFLAVILDSPAPVVKVPAGSYQYQLSVKAGQAEARPLRLYGPNWGSLIVNPTNPATIASGGPLTNSVAIERHGQSLAMNYRLLGAQGEPYLLQGPRKEPQFAIYRPGKSGDKKLVSGAFQFG